VKGRPEWPASKKKWTVLFYDAKGAGGGPGRGIPWFTSREEADDFAARKPNVNPGQRVIVLEIVGTILVPEKPDIPVEAV
jgi:hypothetical protein